MEKKITKKEMFAKIKEAVADNAEMVAFIDHEIELLTRKNARGGSRAQTATQKANEQTKQDILATMEVGEKYTIGELIKIVPNCQEFQTSKMSALVRQLKEAGLVERTEIKRRAYFSKVSE